MEPLVVAVLLKAVTRTEVPARLGPEGHGPRPEEAPLALNRADLAALRMALHPALCAPGRRRRVVAVSVAPLGRVFPLRVALSLGADSALRVWGPDWPEGLAEGRDGSGTTTAFLARAAAAAILPLGAGLMLTGERSADTGHECFAGFLAVALKAGFAHRVTSLAAGAGGWDGVVKLERGYSQSLSMAEPLVASVAATADPPPNPSLPAWLAALEAEIPWAESPQPPPQPCRTTFRAPVPRVQGYTPPAPGMGAEQRIRAMVALPTGGGGTVLGAEIGPEGQAAAVATLLRERGYLT